MKSRLNFHNRTFSILACLDPHHNLSWGQAVSCLIKLESSWTQQAACRSLRQALV